MKAVFVTRHGGPEVLEFRDATDPQLLDDEVLLAVHSTNVNYADIQARSGGYRNYGTPPFVPGLEAAGTIIAVGEGVTELVAGQKVVAFTARGSYAQLAAARSVLTYPLPADLSFDSVAGLTAAVTAENMLRRAGGVGAGDTVLVHAAAGGVGSLAVQLARHRGARVIGTVGSDAKLKTVLDLGAHVVLNRNRENVAERVLELTAGRGANLILDGVGGPGLAANLDCLAPFGQMVIFGQASGQPGSVPAERLFKRNQSVLGYSSGHIRRSRPISLQPVVSSVIELLAAGQLKILIGARFPLREAAAAHELVESRTSIGKVVLEV